MSLHVFSYVVGSLLILVFFKKCHHGIPQGEWCHVLLVDVERMRIGIDKLKETLLRACLLASKYIGIEYIVFIPPVVKNEDQFPSSFDYISPKRNVI